MWRTWTNGHYNLLSAGVQGGNIGGLILGQNGRVQPVKGNKRFSVKLEESLQISRSNA